MFAPIRAAASSDKLLAFGFGVTFVICLLIFAVAIPNPTVFTGFVFRVVLSLAAAGVGAMLPGLVEVRLRTVRLGGALLLAAVVYFMNPPALIHDSIEDKTRSTLDAAYAFINRGNIELARDFIEKARLMTPEPIDIPFFLASLPRGPTNLE